MSYQDILLKLELIEAELDDATNQMPEYNANSDARVSIDSAKDELYNLKDEIERTILDDTKQHIKSNK
jgi:anion-transporting  ArsA/GET3 family ATPase